jgi:hypothetical protein
VVTSACVRAGWVMDEKGWLDRKLDEQDAYRAKFSAWEDAKMSLGFLGLPLLILAGVALILFALFSFLF